MPGVIEERQQEIADFFRESLSQPFARGDYKELVELCLLLVTKGSEPVNFKMFYPGALHRSRWMAKLLYSIKIVVLSGQIKELFPKAEILTNSQISKLERFVVFTVCVYVQWWIVCPVPASAPVNDLILVENLDKFAPHDSTLIEKARKALSRHTWYLTEELVPLALFSPMVSEEIKDEMRMSLLRYEITDITKRVGLSYGGYGKPYLPSIPESGTSLVDLIGPDSFRFFTILGLPYQFLHIPAIDWMNNDDYQKMKMIVDKLQVVNEAAERGVKLCHDFLNVARDENRFQDVLQVVESDRHRIPDQRKQSSASKEKVWFLALENV